MYSAAPVDDAEDGYGKRGMRAITHLDMDDEGVDTAVVAIEQVMSSMT